MIHRQQHHSFLLEIRGWLWSTWLHDRFDKNLLAVNLTSKPENGLKLI